MISDNSQTKPLDKTAVKCRFFAQYYGLEVAFIPSYPDGNDLIKAKVSNIKEIQYLELKPIINDTEYKIPDGWEFYKEYTPKEDGYAGMKIRKQYESNELTLNEDGYKYDMIWPTKINIGIDQYRAEGYAVPFMEYSVEDLISFGWVRLL
jgi:hypothetical protein